MDKVIFSSWQGKIVDNRGLGVGEYIPADNIELPQVCDGRQVRAFMGWDGLVVIDGTVNVIDMAHSYLKEALKVCCGECVAGYIGLKAMESTLAKILDGQGKEGDIDLLTWLGNGIKNNAKCIFGRTMPTPIIDTIEYFRDDYMSLINAPKVISKSIYISEITAPCQKACPAHQDIPGYIDLIKNRRYEESLSLIYETNALPSICGRACYAPCESECSRASIDAPVSIRALKRFVADYEVASGLMPALAKAGDRKQKVAVIGAGPAGLAASYNLALKGYQITIYDELPSPGGMTVVGIPSYRLPREIINREVEIIQRLGVKFQLNTRIGKDITLDNLFKEGFEAIFIATGAHISRKLGIKAEDSQYAVDGVEFLHNVNAGKKPEPKGKVAIIGGGNVAMDCTRTCLRLGFKEVTIIYRRSRDEMPGRKEEIEEAEKEGAKITFLAAPVGILTRGGKVVGVNCTRMKLGEPDASGRRRPIPIPGSEFKIETDMIISAIGEQPDLTFLAEEKEIRTTQRGTIEIDPSSGQTSRSGVFSGGDCATGPATIIEAIASGNRAARSIDQYLRTGHITRTDDQLMEEVSRRVNLLSQRDGGLIAKTPRHLPELLPIPSRLQNFDEVEKTLTTEAALTEAERCLHCYRVFLLATD